MKLKNLLIALLGINFVVAVHEFGHWSMAHLYGVETPEFSIGFGPTLISKHLGTTKFTIAALPLGGYVEIEGVRHAEPGKEQVSFITKPFKHKALILLGGIIFNLLFAFLIFISIGFAPKLTEHHLEQETLPEQQPAERRSHAGVVGPLGIIKIAAKSLDQSPTLFLYFLALLSLNLAIFNLLPLPLLDGGQLLIITLETLQGRQIADTTYHLIMSATLIILVVFLLYTIRKDIQT